MAKGNAALETARRKVTDTLAGFTAGQKVVSVLAVVALLAGAFVFTSWSAKPTYAALFSNLEASDASGITQELTSRKVPYELADDGRTVMVPQSQVHQLRLDMSAAGLPTGGSGGYSLLDKQGITTSEFRQRVDYQRAMEGELAKTVEAIDGVAASTVHLVIPTDDVFADDEKKPTASVLVKNEPGQRLEPGQVQAVVHLVSSSVEGLDPLSVTVADAEGRVLNLPGEEGDVAALGDVQADKTREFEDALSRSVQDMLFPVTGPDGAKVKIKADLDFDKRETVTKNVGESSPSKEVVTNEVYEGQQPTAVGILGPEGVPVDPATSNSNYDKDAASREFAFDEVTEQVRQAPGSVRRLSVAVLLDSGAAEADPVVIEDLVKAAVGFSEARDDVIEVRPLAFDRSAAEEAAAELARVEAARRAAEEAALRRTLMIAAAVGLLALVLLVRRLRRRKPTRVPVALPPDVIDVPLAPVEEEALALEEAEDVLDLDEEAETPELEAAEVLELPTPSEEEERMAIQSELGDLIERQPEEVALLLRSWLSDRRSA